MARAAEGKGKLRIGDDWNAIRIIALSQSNPLKAIAELVENSIDAHARKITITRGREHGEHYLAIRDDGDGVPRDANGIPDFRYVATHICYSGNRRLTPRAGAVGRTRAGGSARAAPRRHSYNERGEDPVVSSLGAARSYSQLRSAH